MKPPKWMSSAVRALWRRCTCDFVQLVCTELSLSFLFPHCRAVARSCNIDHHAASRLTIDELRDASTIPPGVFRLAH